MPAPLIQPDTGGVGTIGTTLAQDQAKAANQGKPGYDILGNPVVSPTTISSANITDKVNPDNTDKLKTAISNQPASVDLQNQRESGGTYQGQDGNYYYNFDNTPTAGSPGSLIPGTTLPMTGDTGVDNTLKQMADLRNRMDTSSAMLMDSITKQFQASIEQQQRVNAGQEAGVNTLLMRGGSMRTASGSGILSTQVSYGISQIGELQAKEENALSQARQAQETNDMQLLDKQMTIYEDIRKEKADAAQKLSETIATENRQASKDRAIAGQISNGVVDPSQILKNLKDLGVTNITSKDVTDTLSNLHPDAKNITELMKTAAGNGASADILKAIGSAKNYTEALTAAGLYGSNATGDLALYQNYVRTAQKAGQTPVPFESWQTQNEYNKAYATGKGTAAGKLAGEGGGGGTGLTQSSIKSQKDFPQNIRPYARQSANGTWYLDMSAISSPERAKLIASAGDVPVVSDKNQANDLINIKDANEKLRTVGNLFKDLTSKSAMARDLGGAGYSSLQAIAQTDPKKAAASAVGIIGLDILKAVSGVQGFRGNQTAIEQVRENLPKVTDTQDTVAQKLNFISQMIADREDTIVGSPGGVDNTNFVIRTEDQATNALIDAGKKDSNVGQQINSIGNSINPKTGQKYTALETAQILGIDIPGMGGGSGRLGTDVTGRDLLGK